MAFARWDPVRDLLALHGIDRLSAGEADWRPPVDLRETPTEYLVSVEVPGLATGDVNVSFEDGHLTIAGVRQQRGSACEQYHRVERGHGSFNRTFQLPLPIDSNAITADMRDGVLTIRCPKASGVPSRRINIT